MILILLLVLPLASGLVCNATLPSPDQLYVACAAYEPCNSIFLASIAGQATFNQMLLRHDNGPLLEELACADEATVRLNAMLLAISLNEAAARTCFVGEIAYLQPSSNTLDCACISEHSCVASPQPNVALAVIIVLAIVFIGYFTFSLLSTVPGSIKPI